ncbi:MAG: DsrE family protein [Candidatus Methanoperedens sp.]|nr:DsrE family protein [Candidatus Methanoperedens sp.]MCE8424449.1 DsrE family protein [Candidatus Methanoperedens sp.]MCE8427000.1 DsrE family protein [Candidatus Methanoperedens sp.]
MKLGILLSTTPENENTNTVISISRAARKHGHDVSIFLMYDGVYNINKKEFAGLIEIGVNITVCALNAEQRKVSKAEGILFGSQYDHACIAEDVDRFLSFG